MGLPSGNVTFLFTDIESSSQRWEDDALQMRAVLARHDDILTGVLARFGGVVFKHLGDGLCAAFDSATACLSAAVAAQGALQAERWPGEVPLLVRMGAHSGEVTPSGGDYFGPPLNRGARVMGAANGGQIVCSAAVATQCPEFSFVDQGYHQLRGIGPERLFLVTEDGYESDQRPLRTAVTARSNVPERLTSFVGRERDVSELIDQVAMHRLVTLVGVGGVGKTSLATVAARALVPRFPGGVWFSELAPVEDPRSVPAAVAQAIGAKVQPRMNTVESIIDFLTDREALIVLDNCEHVLDAASRLVERIVAHSTARVVATSRAPLAAPGEHLLPVYPLNAATNGVTLFVDRARERDPRFSVTGANADHIMEICRRLDGLPLAIELAAGRARAMSPAAIVERLDDRFRLLRGGRKGDRHETLHETLRWSYSLLSDAEAALFDRLSVFAGTFTLSAAESVCADGEIVDVFEVLDLLSGLVDKSMVLAEQTLGDRYQLLETLRQYGRQQLERRGELDEVQRRHVAYYLGLAEEQEPRFWTPAEPDVRNTLDAEWDNLRAAFTYSTGIGDIDTAANLVGALGWYGCWSARDELQAGAEALLSQPSIDSHPRFVDLCGIAAYGAFNRADLQRALDLAEWALADGRHDPSGLLYLAVMGACVNLGDNERTTHFHDAWIADAVTAPSGVRAHPENMMGLFRARMQGSSAGIDFTERGMQLALEGGCPSAISYAYMCRGYTLALADPDEAVTSFRTSIEIAQSLDSRHNMLAFARRGLADLMAQRAPINDALTVCREGLQTTVDHHKAVVTAAILAPTALALSRAGNASTAAMLLGSVTAHGQRPPAAVEALGLHQDHAPELARGETLSIQQAADLAIEAIDQALAALRAH